MISFNLKVALIIVALFLIAIVSLYLSKSKISVKYSLFWYVGSFVILLVGLFPEFVNFFTKLIGFETTSNFVIGILILLLFILALLLTIIVSYQRKQITLLIQEISLLKGEKKWK